AVLDGRTLSFVARDLPATGWRTYRLVHGRTPGWSTAAGSTIENDAYRLTADPARGGTVSSWLDRRLGRELVPPGRTAVRAEISPAGQRLVVSGELDGIRYEQTLTVWTGLSRVDYTTRLRPTGADRLLRLRWPT